MFFDAMSAVEIPCGDDLGQAAVLYKKPDANPSEHIYRCIYICIICIYTIIHAVQF